MDGLLDQKSDPSFFVTVTDARKRKLIIVWFRGATPYREQDDHQSQPSRPPLRVRG